MNRYTQDPESFYVCVRRRDNWGGAPHMVKRIPIRGGIDNAHRELKKAIKKYGSTHRVVIETAEWRIYPKEVLDA